MHRDDNTPARTALHEPWLDDDVVFHGHAGTPAVVTIERGGDTSGVLRPHDRRAPDGFQWGYRGAGSRELARCLIVAALGENGYCGRCCGSGVVPAGFYDQDRDGPVPTKPCRCGDGIAVPAELYRAFVADKVARWRRCRDWQITAGEIRGWLAPRYSRT